MKMLLFCLRGGNGGGNLQAVEAAKKKKNPETFMASGFVLELMTGFEPVTSSLPIN